MATSMGASTGVGMLPDFQAAQSANPTAAPNGVMPPFGFTRAITFDSLERALANGAVQPHACDVFKNDTLLYLFYGRFAYRVHMPENLNSLNNDGPVALIFHEHIASTLKVKRVFPFDSGGYQERYSQQLLQRPVTDFEIPDLAKARELLQYFWKDKNQYFWFDPDGLRESRTIDAMYRYLHLYLGVLQGIGNMGSDDRRGTFEVSVTNPIPLNKDTLIGMVIPQKFSNKKAIVDLNKQGVVVKTYRHFGNSPSEEFGRIQDKVFDILADAKYLKPES